jgi:hypothetical protein
MAKSAGKAPARMMQYPVPDLLCDGVKRARLAISALTLTIYIEDTPR